MILERTRDLSVQLEYNYVALQLQIAAYLRNLLRVILQIRLSSSIPWPQFIGATDSRDLIEMFVCSSAL